MRRLHIGCGKAFLPRDKGWINLDLFSSVQADVYADMTAMPFESNSFDEIYASHVLEHCQRQMVLATLSHWRDLLKPGGVLRLAVPDFHSVVEWYQKTGDLSALIGLLYGGQNHPRNSHTMAFDEKTLTEFLRKVGFENVLWWDWHKTDHAEFDDFSQCYLPHMDKEHGMLMSLNLMAQKPL